MDPSHKESNRPMHRKKATHTHCTLWSEQCAYFWETVYWPHSHPGQPQPHSDTAFPGPSATTSATSRKGHSATQTHTCIVLIWQQNPNTHGSCAATQTHTCIVLIRQQHPKHPQFLYCNTNHNILCSGGQGFSSKTKSMFLNQDENCLTYSIRINTQGSSCFRFYSIRFWSSPKMEDFTHLILQCQPQFLLIKVNRTKAQSAAS